MRIKNSRKSLEKFRNKVDSLSKELNSNPRIGIEFSHPDKIVAFAGLDPKVKISGNKKTIGGPNKRGSKTLRWALGMAVHDMKKTNPVIGLYFDRKLAEGKHYNTARCAAAKKLVRIIWSVEKNKKPFQIPESVLS